MRSRSGRVLALGMASLAATTIAAGLATSGFGAPAGDRAVHPNPAVANIAVDYEASPRAPDGTPSDVGPLTPAVIAQALADQRYLAYQTVGDLGGFKPAPVGHLAWSSGGHAVVGGTFKSQVPHYAQAGSGQVNSFAFIGSPAPTTTPPDNGRQPVPGIGVPPTTPPATSTPVPPPNQGFAGTPTTSATATTTPATTTAPPTTTTRRPPPTTTTVTPTTAPTTTTRPPTTTPSTTTAVTTTAITTTAETTTSATTTTSSGGTSSSGGGGSSSSTTSCGTTGLSITSDHSSCVLYATNMAPGQSTSEVMTIKNTADVAYSIYLRCTGTQNHLWNDLKLAVWQVGTAAPSPLPPLLDWTTQDNKLALSPLQPGDSVKVNVELLLPSTAGNADQNLKAVIAFVWKAIS